MNVIISPEVQGYLDNLVLTLYRKEYFGFEEQAVDYVHNLLDDIKADLPKRQHKLASSYFEKYGKGVQYASFRKNKQTEWYAFFTTHEVENEKIYLVRYVANNHTVAQYL
jgi:hypothetical protein